MKRQFFCGVCDLTFVTWVEMKEHFQSMEHKTSTGQGRLRDVINKFSSRLGLEESDDRPENI